MNLLHSVESEVRDIGPVIGEVRVDKARQGQVGSIALGHVDTRQ